MPIIYSFRRCPYAMRARLAIRSAELTIELREVLLKNKPDSMLAFSAKGTVPVLVLDDQTVIDESVDIMYWSLAHTQSHTSIDLLPTHLKADIEQLIAQNDNVFKTWLDKYKYFDRFPEHDQLYYRTQACKFIAQLEQQLERHTQLMSEHASLADLAVFPFIRQFAFVDIKWFESCEYPNVRTWLNHWINSELFDSVMTKIKPWQEGDDVVFL
jgi:glutathione S-transferase